jgi:hypothetical protein
VISLKVEINQMEEKKKCFDLLDLLSQSGSLPFGIIFLVDKIFAESCLENTSLHVVIASTHVFDKTIVDTGNMKYIR